MRNHVRRTSRAEARGGLWEGLETIEREGGVMFWHSKTARSMAEALGLPKGKQHRVPGRYETPLEAVEARGRCLFRTIRRLERCAPTHPTWNMPSFRAHACIATYMEHAFIPSAMLA